jgi:hypothetical protein
LSPVRESVNVGRLTPFRFGAPKGRENGKNLRR